MSVWVQVSSAQGPAECQWVVARVVEAIDKEAVEQRVECRVLEKVAGEEDGIFRSALLALQGDHARDLVEGWRGTVQWIGQSPFRPQHKRKNWYIGVEVYSPPATPSWSESELRIDLMRSSGPGGQHVNKTSSAVRITHVPTGLTAIAQEERSQHRNRSLALARLARLFEARKTGAETEAKQGRWAQHANVERGSPVRVFQGIKFRIA